MDAKPDELVKTHRQRQATLAPGKAWNTDDEHHPRTDEDAFVNPGPDQPVPTAEFLGHLDLSFLRPALLDAYTQPENLDYDPAALLKADAFKALRKDITSWRQLGHYLATHPQDALAVGFQRNEAGIVETPSGEWIRQFSKNYLGNLGWQRIIHDDLARINQQLTAHDQPPLGARVTKDLTPLEGRGHTDCMAYSDYYEVHGYGFDPVLDRNHGLPLVYELAPLTHNEDANLVPSLEALHGLDVTVEHITIDGGYTSFRNFAYLAAHRIQPTCKITQDWVVHEDVTTSKLRQRYQGYWQHADFENKPSIPYIEAFLHDRGEHDLVGKHERNRVMAEYEECPGVYREVYGQRNKSENVNNRFKNDMGLISGWRGTGIVDLDLRIKRLQCALLLVGLTRLQNGVVERLSNLQGLC